MITDEDFDEFSPLHNPITLAQPSHVGPSVEVTVSKAISVYDSTRDDHDDAQTPLKPSGSKERLNTNQGPKASTNSLTLSDAALLQIMHQDMGRG